MLNYICVILIVCCQFFILSNEAKAQSSYVDSLNQELANTSSDTLKGYLMSDILKHYVRNNPDSAIILSTKLFAFLDQIDVKPNREVVNYLRAGTYSDIGIAYYFKSQFDSSLHYASKAIPIHRKLEDLNALCTSLNLMGVVLEKQGNQDSALACYMQIYEHKSELKGSRILGAAFNNIGLILVSQTKYAQAIKYYHESIAIKTENNDSSGIGTTYSNIGLIYNKMHEYERALEYFRKGLQIDILIKDERKIAGDYNNIGTVYQAKKNTDSTLYYYYKGLDIREHIEDKFGMSSSLNNLGSYHLELAEKIDDSNLDSALVLANIARKQITRSLQIREEIGYLNGVASCLNNLGTLERNYFSVQKSIEYCTRANEIAVEKNFLDRELASCSCLANAYESLGQLDKAFPFYVRYRSLEDSLNNLEKSKAVSQQLLEKEYQTKKMTDSLENLRKEELKQLAQARKEDQLKQESKRQELYAIAGAILALIMLILFFVMLRSYRIKKQANLALEEKNILILEQKSQVESQKEIIEEKNKDITDSIVYAKRIQDAMLPTLEAIQSGFPESFVMYEPKDIVAGDFYWYQSIGNHVMIAAADCTGHGVPGAMVSIVCNNGLNRAVKEFGLTDPGQILDKTREIVLQEFHASRQEGEKSDENVKDGMDIALCVFNGQQLTYSGAHNPLWIVRSDMNEIEEIKADKQPIGQFDQARPYQTHEVALNKGDSVYIFTDGYADQFGGESGRPGGKKFKTIRLKNIILSNQDKSMDEQRELLTKTFYDWKGDYEQLDDVCVIGVRI